MNESAQESKRSKNESDLSMLSDEESFVVLGSSPSSESLEQFCTNKCSSLSINQQVDTFVINKSPLPSINPPYTSGIIKSLNGKTLMERQMPSDTHEIFSMDLSAEEIQIKLNEVLQENLELKETLHQNNLAMKQQLTTLRSWQDEVSKSHQNHKEKFSETKALIIRLRTENEELKKAFIEQESKIVTVTGESEGALLEANRALTTQVNILQKQVTAMNARNETSCKKEQELISLTEQLNRQLELVERSKRQLTVDNERLQSQKARVERDVVILKVELESQKQKTDAMEKENSNLKIMHKAEPPENHAHQEEVIALKAQISKQQDVIEDLIRQQAINMAPATKENGVAKFQVHQRKLEESNIEMGKQNERFSSLSSWLEVASENINKFETSALGDSQLVKDLQLEINAVKKLLAEEQEQGQEKAKLLVEAQRQFQNLFSDYQSVLQDLEDLNKRPNQTTLERQSLTYYEVQVRGFTEKIDNMTAQIMNLTDSRTQKDQQIAELTEKIRTLEAENETIAVLQIQMQVYQSDFNAEREARESLAGEKERLAEDLRHLQRRNQQLLNELKLTQQNHGDPLPSNISNGWSTISTPGRNHARENTPPSPGPHDF